MINSIIVEAVIHKILDFREKTGAFVIALDLNSDFVAENMDHNFKLVIDKKINEGDKITFISNGIRVISGKRARFDGVSITKIIFGGKNELAQR